MINSNIRIIRFPIDLRGRQYISYGKGFTTGRYCRLEVYNKVCETPSLTFGDNVQLNDSVHITVMKSVAIGDNVLMASHVYISDCQHGDYSGDSQSSPNTIPIDRLYKTSPVIIEDNVWIGDQVCILPGVKIGKGSIIGANSVVTHSLPAGCIAAGSPAVVKKRWDTTIKQWVKIHDEYAAFER